MNHEYKSVGFVANGANLVDNMQWFVSATALVAYDGVFDVFVELGRVFKIYAPEVLGKWWVTLNCCHLKRSNPL